MKNVILKIIGMCAAVLFTVSCSEQSKGVGDTQGLVKISLKTDNSVDETLITKAEPNLTASDFKIRIENTRGEVLKSWNSYDDLPEALWLQAGSYKLVAWYGGDVLPNFGDSYYYGENKFAVADGESVDVEVECTMAATKVAVFFDESFDYDYSEYSVDIKTTGNYLTFTGDETREAYFVPGNMYLRFNLKSNKDGQTYTYHVPEPIVTLAREFHKFDIKVDATASIIISTDFSTEDIVVDIDDIPSSALPKAAPVVTLPGDLSITEGDSKDAVVTAKAAGGIVSFVIKTDSPALLAAGWDAETDLLTATAEMKVFLKNSGLVWNTVLDNPEKARKVTGDVTVDFTDVLSNLAATGAPYGFEVIVTDRFDQINTEAVFMVTVLEN